MEMSTILFIAAALILVYLAFTNFRGFLLFGASLAGIGGDVWMFHAYGLYGKPNIIYFIFPIATLLTTGLVYLAFTNFRRFLISMAILAVIVGSGWLFFALAPIIVGLLVVWLVLSGGISGGSDLFDAFLVHSFVPSVSVGEAYVARQSGLL